MNQIPQEAIDLLMEAAAALQGVANGLSREGGDGELTQKMIAISDRIGDYLVANGVNLPRR